MPNTSDSMVGSFSADGQQLCSFQSSSLSTGLQHFHFHSQKINVVVKFQECNDVDVSIPPTEAVHKEPCSNHSPKNGYGH
jgi:hypothetical protein